MYIFYKANMNYDYLKKLEKYWIKYVNIEDYYWGSKKWLPRHQTYYLENDFGEKFS